MDQKVNIIRTENWKRLIMEANRSVLSKSEWCRQNDINIKTFFYWQRKIRLMEAEKVLSSSELPALCPEQKTATPPSFVDMTQLYKETASLADIPSKELTQPVFSPQLMLLAGQYRILVGDTATEQILSNVLKAVRNA